ncbi:hypothetical protein GTW43_11940 [Streptomyces sp. SID5785]|uniref:hypothetical protein n=1 Tax=Streptomyces sp. SID5785 TaxID=2690309 RepID=UPI001360DEF5|nr:hypothetical protein [Streptomyces sp. SID5785]MZD05791.1 hypothetical protein [Streptomyces sp. SID5785]
MTANPTQDSCDHRALEVSLLLSASTVVGLMAGILLTVLGTAPGPAVAGGAAALAGAFGLGMSALSYVRKQAQ